MQNLGAFPFLDGGAVLTGAALAEGTLVRHGVRLEKIFVVTHSVLITNPRSFFPQ